MGDLVANDFVRNDYVRFCVSLFIWHYQYI